MRIAVDLPEPDLTLLQTAAERQGISRAAFICSAIAAALAPWRATMSHEAFGLWAGHAEDGLEYQKRVRSEW